MISGQSVIKFMKGTRLAIHHHHHQTSGLIVRVLLLVPEANPDKSFHRVSSHYSTYTSFKKLVGVLDKVVECFLFDTLQSHSEYLTPQTLCSKRDFIFGGCATRYRGVS